MDWEKTGKCLFLAKENNIEYLEVSNNDMKKCLLYCVDTYDEFINDIPFEEWVKNGNETGKPIILDANQFRTLFSEIAENNVTIESMIDDIREIYDIDFWKNDFFYEYDAIIYTTMYHQNYRKIDNKAIAMAMERMMTLQELGIDTESDRQEFIASINEAMNDYFKNTDKTVDELLYEVNRVTGGYLQ